MQAFLNHFGFLSFKFVFLANQIARLKLILNHKPFVSFVFFIGVFCIKFWNFSYFPTKINQYHCLRPSILLIDLVRCKLKICKFQVCNQLNVKSCLSLCFIFVRPISRSAYLFICCLDSEVHQFFDIY